MSPEVAVVLSVAFACATAAWAVWLKFRGGEKSVTPAEYDALVQRMTRVENEVRQPRGIAPIQMPNRMQAR